MKAFFYMVYKVEFLRFCCEPHSTFVHKVAIEQPRSKNLPTKELNVVREEIISKNRTVVFGSPKNKPFTLASRRVIRYINRFLKKEKYPTIELDKFFDINAWWDADTMVQTRSPLVSLPAISKQAGKAIFSKITKGDGVWRFEYLANQDTKKREHHNFRAVVYVSFDGDILCSKANHQQIVDAGF